MGMNKDYDLYLFDLDGTLMDSREIIGESINASIEFAGKPRVNIEEVYPFIGLPFKDYFDHFLGVERPNDDDLIRVYREHFRRNINLLRLFPDVKESLERLKDSNKKIATMTTRPIENVHDVLNFLEIHDLFDYFWGIGVDEFHKPDAGCVYTVTNYFDMPLEQTVLVGDSITDLNTAKNAKVDFVGVTFGTLGKEGMVEHGVERVINSLKELVEF